jgi:pyrroloquinoline quinone biosynthesis protein B
MIESGTGAKQNWPPHGAYAHRGAGWFPCRTRGRCRRRVYVHVNNTNPILIEGSPERVEVERKGWRLPRKAWRSYCAAGADRLARALLA